MYPDPEMNLKQYVYSLSSLLFMLPTSDFFCDRAKRREFSILCYLELPVFFLLLQETSPPPPPPPRNRLFSSMSISVMFQDLKGLYLKWGWVFFMPIGAIILCLLIVATVAFAWLCSPSAAFHPDSHSRYSKHPPQHDDGADQGCTITMNVLLTTHFLVNPMWSA